MSRSEITILFVGVNPDNTALLDLTQEAETIETRLRDAEHRERFELEQRWKTAVGELPGLLLRYRPQILHFSGHGTSDGRLYFRGANGRAVAADGASIARLFEVVGGVRCVVLNACHSSEQARSIAAHVDVVIGMSEAIRDADAVRFAAGFYEGLGYGQDVHTAFELGRLQVGLHTQFDDDACVLHLREGVDAKATFLHRGDDDSAADPEPSQVQRVQEQLSQLDEEYERRTISGEDLSELDEQKLALRRQLRSGPSLAPDDVLAGRYRLIERAGAGGFATVWKAYDRERKRNVAVKVLHGQWIHDRSRVERFIAGSRRMDMLDHPAVVSVLEAPREDDAQRLFFVLPWFEGGDLDQATREQGLGRDARLAAVARVLEGLAHAHERGIVHRDVKPGNILIDADGRGAITDFDLAHARNSTHGTKAGLGTFAYAAPEQQVDASEVDARADVYGAGMCVLFALTGRHPRPLQAAHNPAVIDGLACGERLRAVLKGAVAYEAEERTTSCLELAAAILAELEGEESEEKADARTSSASNSEVPATDEQPETITVYGVELVLIPGGSFKMGSPAGVGHSDEHPQHEVKLASFYLAKTPVTNAQYATYLEANPKADKPEYWANAKYNQAQQPVVGVSWDEAQAYCKWAGLVLPTEAQWEYAARAGTTTKYWSGDTEDDLARVGWYSANAGRQLHAVAEKQPNPFGLYDVHGNVWEWCLDGWGASYEKTSPRTGDGLRREPVGDADRVVRGGSWYVVADFARSAYRNNYWPVNRYFGFGFRPAQGIP